MNTVNKSIALAVIALMIVADVGLFLSAATDEVDAEGEYTVETVATDESDVRLQIYGNANGDDYIDQNDIVTLQYIVDHGMSNWSEYFPFADANQDGTIDEEDVSVVQTIIDGDEVRMYYLNWYDYVSYVNYPISSNIMCDYSTFELLCATHTFDRLMAIDQSATIYIGKYAGLDECIVIPTNGNNEEHTLESLATAAAQGVGTIIQWTGGGATNYLWEKPGIDNIANEISIVSLTIQGPDCINGALMFAQMLGDITLADDYKAWYDNATGLFSEIGTSIEKKTVSAIRCFESDQYGTYRMYGSDQSPALWLNMIINFQDAYVGKSGFTVLNSLEELVSSATEEIILITQRRDGTTYEQFNNFAQERLDTLYGRTGQYSDGTIYMIEWEALPFFSGPAGCYILASYLYPEHFALDDAYDYLQTYLDLFSPNEDADARVGFTYTSGTASGGDDAPAEDDSPSGDDTPADGGDNTMMYVGAIVAVVIVAAVAVYLYKRNN